MSPAKPGRENGEALAKEVGQKADRMIKGRLAGHRSAWFGLGMFGLIGWSVAVPAVVGALVGQWLNTVAPGRINWAIALILAGIAIGCINAVIWLNREGTVADRREKTTGKSTDDR